MNFTYIAREDELKLGFGFPRACKQDLLRGATRFERKEKFTGGGNLKAATSRDKMAQDERIRIGFNRITNLDRKSVV